MKILNSDHIQAVRFVVMSLKTAGFEFDAAKLQKLTIDDYLFTVVSRDVLQLTHSIATTMKWGRRRSTFHELLLSYINKNAEGEENSLKLHLTSI